MKNSEQPEIEIDVTAFKPGQVAKQSGVYRVDHRRHGESHEVTAQSFPVAQFSGCCDAATALDWRQP
jgi:hypothetical protein